MTSAQAFLQMEKAARDSVAAERALHPITEESYERYMAALRDGGLAYDEWWAARCGEIEAESSHE